MRDGPQQELDGLMQTWNLEGRRIANWKTCEWQPYPGLDGDTPGLLRGKPESKLGLNSSDTSALTFERLRVPADQLLGGSVVRPFEM